MSTGPDLSRRQAALRLLAAAMAGSLGSCGKPEEEILPYVEQPEGMVQGLPLRFATTLALNGFGRGVLCTSFEGRPIKVEGNPAHPASLGATDVFAEAALMTLYDPDRSRSIRQGGRPGTWDGFQAMLLPRLRALEPSGGAGLRLLTGPVTSPTLLRAIAAVQQRFPAMRWHAHAAIGDENAQRGAALAYGRPVTLLPRLDRAEVVVTLDADPLGPGPDQIRAGREFATRRLARRECSAFLRLYAVEPAPTLTGANADHVLPLAPAALHRFVPALAAALGAPLPPPVLPDAQQRFLAAVAQDLAAHPGAAMVLAGEALAPELHALVHWMNARLGAPVQAIEPVWPPRYPAPDGLDALVRAMHAGEVELLVVAGGANPAYDAPADQAFAEARRQVPFVVHHGLHVDETAALADWHIPAPNALEDWGDLRAVDGTASIVQPLIRPLYGTRSGIALLGLFAGRHDASAHAAVRETWSARHAGPETFEAWWRQALHRGVIADSAAPPLDLPPPRLPAPSDAPSAQGLVLVLRPDASVWDGGHANNAWLQECPRPLTRQAWGNAALIAPEEAAARGLQRGDVVRLAAASGEITLPLLPLEGVAQGVVAVALGYGRWRAGAIGNGIGANAYPLRRSDAPWVVPDVALAPTGNQEPPVLAQEHWRLEGEARELLPVVALAEALHPPDGPDEHVLSPPSFYPEFAYPTDAWAMVIDTTLCIGCNACVVACQAENNIPVVGPKEMAWGRSMHWLRIDTYVQEIGGRPRPGFQPVPCMHCEKAPCEPVCPVAASVHDHEGLNLQVYNRCIGTRFCQANCPYKVRRFNFFGYADGQEYANLGEPVVAAHYNPDVTVRARGVMEKCTYCVQRISAARRNAGKEKRPIAEGEVVTACQTACPTTAIRFGDLNRPGSAPSRLRQEPHHYALLGHLGTQPRTTYLKRVRNPNPALEGEDSQ